MINFLTSNRKWILGIYIVLTIIKLFTATIGSQREEDPTIYFKLHPTINNIFFGSDKDIERYSIKYSWYRNNQYWEIFHSSGHYIVWDIYRILIILWWVSSAGLVVFAGYKLLKR